MNNNSFFGKLDSKPLESGDNLIIESLPTPSNTLSVNADWIPEIRTRIKASFGDDDGLANKSGVDWRDCFWFANGNPVIDRSFRVLSQALALDWQKIQTSKYD